MPSGGLTHAATRVGVPDSRTATAHPSRVLAARCQQAWGRTFTPSGDMHDARASTAPVKTVPQGGQSTGRFSASTRAAAETELARLSCPPSRPKAAAKGMRSSEQT